MSGKCRPSLRKKTLEIVKHSNLSQTNKDCIAEVFKRYEETQREKEQTMEDNNVKCKECESLMFSDCYGECSKGYKGIVNSDDSCGKGKRKTTDNDIIKALGICPHEHLGCEDGCPYLEVCNEVNPKSLIKDALDLINRQKEEIERLSNFVTEERCIEIANEMIPQLVKQARAEAITEFVERLKGDNFKVPVDAFTSAYVLGDDDIDQIAKEMKGEQ